MAHNIMDVSKNGRWVITRGKFNEDMCSWNVKDTFANKKCRIQAAYEGEELAIIATESLPPYVLSTIAKLQKRHEAEVAKDAM